MFLAENLDESSTKLANTITTEWKESLQDEIDEDIVKGAVDNWLEKPRWVRGAIEKLSIEKLQQKFDRQSHYEHDLYLGITKADTFLVDISFDEKESLTDKAVIVRAILEADQEK